MLSDTLRKELRHYAIGEEVRTLPLGKKMGLVELGRRGGTSAKASARWGGISLRVARKA